MSDHPDIGTEGTAVGTAAAAVAPGPFQPPPRIGPFRLERLLGRGGMAAVYLAAEQGTGRTVAVKLMDPNLKGDRTFIDRFLNEAKACASLHHPNVVELVSHGEHEGWYYLATEFVDGGTVAQLIGAMGGLPTVVATELFAQLMAGLAYAHSVGIVHRDLKPENLLLTAGGILKVGDFGIARTIDHQKLTRTGMLVGTAGYMSPEQARGDQVTHHSDLFTSGIILFEMLTGQNPFSAENAAVSLTRILSGQPPSLYEAKPSVPAELDQLVDRLLASKPGDRPSSASEVFELMMLLVARRRSEHPTLLAECLKRPTDMKRQLDSQAAATLVTEAQALMSGGQLEKNRAAFKLYSARLLDPHHHQATAELARLSQELGLRFGPPNNPKIAELERTLANAPGAPAVLQQLAQLYKLEGNLLQSAHYVKKYLKVKPNDGYAANQLFQLTGERVNTPLQHGEATRELMAGVKTGGFKAANRGSGAPTALVRSAPGTAGQLTVTEVKAHNPLVTLGKRVAVFGVLAAVAVLGLRALMGWIDRATEETDRATVQLRDGIAGTSPPVPPKGAGTAEGPAVIEQPRGHTEPLPQVDDGVEAALADALGKKADAALTDARSKQALTGDDEQALLAFVAVARTWPETPAARRALLERSRTLLKLRRNSEAQEALSAFLHEYPSDALAAEALVRRAQARAQNLADDDALADLDGFLAGHPLHPLAGEALLWRAEVKARRGADGARDDFNAAKAKLEPTDALQERVAAGLAKLDEP